MGVAEAGARQLVCLPLRAWEGAGPGSVCRWWAQPHPFVQRVELAVAPLHGVSAPVAQHLHSEHLAGAGGQPGAREARRVGAAGPAPGDAPTLRPQRHKAAWERQGALLSRDPPTSPHTWGLCSVQSVPQEPGPPSEGLASQSGPETLGRVSPDGLGRRAQTPSIRRREIRRVPAPLPIHCPHSPCGVSRGSAGSPRPRAPPTGCELPASTRRWQPNSPRSDQRPRQRRPRLLVPAGLAPTLAPPRAFPSAAGSCKGLIRL